MGWGAVCTQDGVFSWHHAGHGVPGRGSLAWAPRPPSPCQEHRAAFQILCSPSCGGRGLEAARRQRGLEASTMAFPQLGNWGGGQEVVSEELV